ncbi:MAG TPA: FG-GAP-like repeat-containing protein [Candidatus Binatia bacterium]|nr:FG-GAP-like repeat-containing protein [Candidatus Binatia bacterium]
MSTSRSLFASLFLASALTASSFAQFVSAADLNFFRSDNTTGKAPYGVAVGDFNHDGFDDIAVANDDGLSVSVLIGNGNGTFQPHVDYSTGGNSTNVATTDLNGDGKLDLVVTSGGLTGSVSVFLGNGDGTFQPAASYTVGNNPYSPVFGDFNRDGKIDIIVANFSDSTFSLLLGNGDGTFQTAKTLPASHQTGSLVTADFNRDGCFDLAGADNDDNLMTVYLGDCTGGFAGAVDYKAGSQPSGIAAGDLNGDKIVDLAVLNVCAGNSPVCVGGNGAISIFIGKGDGTFQAQTQFDTGSDSLGISLNDFNGDGKLDAVVSNGCNQCNTAGSVSVLLGNGDGTLQAQKQFTVGNLPDGIATGHFAGNGQGSADIAVANLDSYVGQTVSVLLNEAGTRVELTSSPNPSQPGQPVTFTVRVLPTVNKAGTPSGSINIYDGKNSIVSGQLNNGIFSAAVDSLPAGANKITAQYAGSTAFNPNVSALLRQIVK